MNPPKFEIEVNYPPQESHHLTGLPVRFEATVLHGTAPIHWQAQFQEVGTGRWNLLHADALAKTNEHLPRFTHTFSDPGLYLVRFDAQDQLGYRSASQTLIRIEPQRPLVSEPKVLITQPRSDVSLKANEPFTVKAQVVEGKPPLKFTAQVQDGGRWYPIHTKEKVAESREIVFRHMFNHQGDFLIAIIVEDSRGKRHANQVRVHVPYA